ncbi:nucleotide-binding alpha-beta plait domain-containing protein [Tanacetum coccineum]
MPMFVEAAIDLREMKSGVALLWKAPKAYDSHRDKLLRRVDAETEHSWVAKNFVTRYTVLNIDHQKYENKDIEKHRSRFTLTALLSQNPVRPEIAMLLAKSSSTQCFAPGRLLHELCGSGGGATGKTECKLPTCGVFSSWDVIGVHPCGGKPIAGTTKVGHQRYTTKEDDVDRISTSVYVTNFPDNVSAKELFLACKQYGHVVDSYIPVKKSKYGKRFGFVKFINVFSEERLVNNLCTVWIGRVSPCRISSIPRPNGKNKGEGNKKQILLLLLLLKPNLSGRLCNEKSLQCVQWGYKDEVGCPIQKKALVMKAFPILFIKYMGEQMVMLGIQSLGNNGQIQKCVSVMSWFSSGYKATNEFEVEWHENSNQKKILKSLTEVRCIGLELMKLRCIHGGLLDDVIKVDRLWEFKNGRSQSKFGRNSLEHKEGKEVIMIFLSLNIQGLPKTPKKRLGKDLSEAVGNSEVSLLWDTILLQNSVRLSDYFVITKSNSGTRKNDQLRLKKQFEEIDLDIDRGLGNEELVNSRLAILHQIQKIDNLESKERAQKAKINGR